MDVVRAVVPYLLSVCAVAALVCLTTLLYRWMSGREDTHRLVNEALERQPAGRSQPVIAGYATCARCPVELVGYAVAPSVVHWQHVKEPSFAHHPDIVTRAFNEEMI